MAGYFNDGNGVKNITNGYFYDGDVKYYKDVVTTKYWKEITTGGRELEYACYHDDKYAVYVNPPEQGGAFYTKGGAEPSAGLVSNSSELKAFSHQYLFWVNDIPMWGMATLSHHPENDLYKDTTTTTVVEGTPEDYTYTTTETTTVEVSADDEYDYKEYYPKKIKQIYKVINGEAKLIFNNE